MSGYGQFCPVAKAMEVLDERWTMLVVRELILGSRRFNELRKGNPKMSPALLSKRLRTLEQVGVIRRETVGGHASYTLTQAGQELEPVVKALGAWGTRWIGELGDADLDPHLLMWDIRRNVPVDLWPRTRTTVAFRFDDVPARLVHWWMVVADGDVDVCDFDPGYDVAATVHTSLRTLTEIWRGDISWERALGNSGGHDRRTDRRAPCRAGLVRPGHVRGGPAGPGERAVTAFDDLDARLAGWVDEQDFSAAVLMTQAGDVVFEGSYGLADRAAGIPITPATRFGLASVTKMFTAVAIVDLVASGSLTFETPVVDVLPPERRPSTLLPEVTVHHLLCHTSGIADYCEEDEDSPAYLEDYGIAVGAAPVVLHGAAGRLPAALRRPPAVPPPRHAVAVLQRRLHRARAGHRGADRSAVHRRRAGARLRPRRDDGERLLPPRRGAAGHRRRLPAAHRARTSRGGRTSTASRWSAVPTAAR